MNFKKIITEILGVYLNDYEFELKSQSDTKIEFNHKVLLIIFTYDSNNSFEVDATFISKKTNAFYSFLEVKQYFDNVKNDFTAFQTADEILLINRIIEIKEFLKNHLNELLKNHELIFNQLEKQSEKRALDYNNNREYELFINDFNKIWKNKDYSKLIEFCEKNIENVKGVFMKKYEYSKNFIKKE